MLSLRARLVCAVPSLEGPQVEMMLIEPNGDEYRILCLCKRDGTTDIGGDPEAMAFLNAKYGSQAVCGLARQVTLGTL